MRTRSAQVRPGKRVCPKMIVYTAEEHSQGSVLLADLRNSGESEIDVPFDDVAVACWQYPEERGNHIV